MYSWGPLEILKSYTHLQGRAASFARHDSRVGYPTSQGLLCGQRGGVWRAPLGIPLELKAASFISTLQPIMAL